MDTFINIIGYIILGISILITLGYCFRIRETAKKDQSREKSMELQAFLMTASVILIPLMNLSNFHLLWLIPASFILGLLSISTPLNILWFFSSIYFSFWYIGISNGGQKNTEKGIENLEDKIEESKRELEILLKQKSYVEKEMLQLQSIANTIDQTIESTFTLCSKYSISLALQNINMLTQNNENDKRLYKSFRSLKCSREDLKRSFYFLKDCIYFCENEPLYNNNEFLSNLSGLEMQVVIWYLDVDPNDIPNDARENHNFGNKFEQMKNLGEKQLEELKLINWRSKEHWQFWAEKYGKTDILAQYCLVQANK